MTITILDFLIVTVPLVVLAAALLSRVRESLNRRQDAVNEVKKVIRQAHIDTLQEQASRNRIQLSRRRERQSRPPTFLAQAR